jgi:putative transposase
MDRKIPFAVDEFYHLYSRGVNKGKIFWDDGDRRRFLMLLYLCNGTETVHLKNLKSGKIPYKDVFSVDRGEPLVAIGAYCLMPNHFHLFIREVSEGGASLFMKKLLTGFAMYINKRHERTGPLFTGRFKSEHIGTDNYFHYLYSYIHLNPIKILDPGWKQHGLLSIEGAVEYLDRYRYSSYRDYLGGDRPEAKILNRERFPDFFQESGSFEKFHKYWLSYKQQ